MIFYHVTSRGNEQKEIFKSISDREKFLSYLESATERYGASIHAYCLMDNHYHILIETPFGNLSKIMQHINGAYTSYFNRKQERIGHLFQGRYTAILVEADAYAKELSRYIHLNPVKAGIVKKPEQYHWSSFLYYAINQKAPHWLHRDFILGYFNNKEKYAMKMYYDFVNMLLVQEYESPLANLPHSCILGSKDFTKKIKDNFLRNRQIDRELPELKKTINRPGLDLIEQVVDSVFETDEKLARQVKLFICHNYSGNKLRQIGDHFGISESAVTQASGRIRAKQENEKSLKKMILKAKRKLFLLNVKINNCD